MTDRRCILCTAHKDSSRDHIHDSWHKLDPNQRRQRPVDICASCWEEVRDNPAPKGALAPTVYLRGMEDGDDHCEVCGETYDGDAVGGDDSDGWHTHKQCFEEGLRQGSQDADIQNGVELAERIGVQGGYFQEVLKHVPAGCSLAEWLPFIKEIEDDIDENKAYWLVWNGVVQKAPAYWEQTTSAWWILGERVEGGIVSHFMACPVPEAPRG